MKPIGLTFKKIRKDKYGKSKQGELMLIHYCQICGKISINRIAADDNTNSIIKVFESSKRLDPLINKQLIQQKIKLLAKSNENELKIQLFGKKI